MELEVKENDWVVYINNPTVAYQVAQVDTSKLTHYILLKTSNPYYAFKWLPIGIFKKLITKE